MSAVDLCAACGMCCNGVLFHDVRLGPEDSPKELISLGVKLRRKKGQYFIRQSCPAFRGTCCSIYAKRPQRCRAFACQQLEGVETGALTESAALEKIHEAKELVERVTLLLRQLGDRNEKRDLARRYQLVCGQQGEGASEPRRQLTVEMTKLEAFLREHFRVEPASQ